MNRINYQDFCKPTSRKNREKWIQSMLDNRPFKKPTPEELRERTERRLALFKPSTSLLLRRLMHIDRSTGGTVWKAFLESPPRSEASITPTSLTTPELSASDLTPQPGTLRSFSDDTSLATGRRFREAQDESDVSTITTASFTPSLEVTASRNAYSVEASRTLSESTAKQPSVAERILKRISTKTSTEFGKTTTDEETVSSWKNANRISASEDSTATSRDSSSISFIRKSQLPAMINVSESAGMHRNKRSTNSDTSETISGVSRLSGTASGVSRLSKTISPPQKKLAMEAHENIIGDGSTISRRGSTTDISRVASSSTLSRMASSSTLSRVASSSTLSRVASSSTLSRVASSLTGSRGATRSTESHEFSKLTTSREDSSSNPSREAPTTSLDDLMSKSSGVARTSTTSRENSVNTTTSRNLSRSSSISTLKTSSLESRSKVGFETILRQVNPSLIRDLPSSMKPPNVSRSSISNPQSSISQMENKTELETSLIDSLIVKDLPEFPLTRDISTTDSCPVVKTTSVRSLSTVPFTTTDISTNFTELSRARLHRDLHSESHLSATDLSVPFGSSNKTIDQDRIANMGILPYKRKISAAKEMRKRLRFENDSSSSDEKETQNRTPVSIIFSPQTRQRICMSVSPRPVSSALDSPPWERTEPIQTAEFDLTTLSNTLRLEPNHVSPDPSLNLQIQSMDEIVEEPTKPNQAVGKPQSNESQSETESTTSEDDSSSEATSSERELLQFSEKRERGEAHENTEEKRKSEAIPENQAISLPRSCSRRAPTPFSFQVDMDE